MKKMIVAMTALLLTIGSQVMAQPHRGEGPKERPTAEQMAQRRTERLTKRLSLTDEQARQVYDMTYEQARKCVAEREKNDAQRMERMKAVREAQDTRMKSILTPEQYAQWQEMQKNECDGMRRGHKGKKGCGPRNECCGRSSR